jgi:beta-glucosidase
LQELKGFKRITLDPGAKKTVTFTLNRKSLEFLNYSMKPVLEPGTIEVMVGASSADIKQNGKFTIVEKSTGRKHK